ncbi:glycosyltransferase family 39 protein [Aggregatilinea lenta]|uniref:glycosyltransferase family 39 protein n=1 Tax=Aggregatilinea lenta TaxID=913108 RepID=UPI000E5A1A33|nr:glycosyltransferase family 39 protein [Aggregatilinea lenta]
MATYTIERRHFPLANGSRTTPRRDTIALVVILLVAAIARLHDLAGITVYLFDQGELVVAAQNMAAGQGIPLEGIASSAGVPNSPVTVYTLALPALFTHNVQVITAIIALFNVIGVGLLWALVRRTVGPTAAALAGFAYALHPYAVTYSRSIWAQDYQITFILAALLLGVIGFIEGKRWAQVLCLPVLIWGVQIHYAAWTMTPVVLGLLWLGRRRIAWRALIASGVLAVLLLVPFVLGASESSGSFESRTADMRAIIKYDLRLRGETIDRVVDVATGRGVEYLADPALADHALPAPLGVWYALGVLMIGGYAAAWAIRAWRPLALLLTLWIVPPVAFFLPNWTGTGIYTHYFIYLIPAFCLLLALSVTMLLRALHDRRIAQGVVVSAFGLAVLSWGWWQISVLRAADTHYTPDGLPTPLHYLMNIRETLLSYDDVLIVGGDSKSSGYEVWDGLLYDTDRCVREVVATGGDLAVFPARPFAVISPPTAPPSALDALYGLGGARAIPLRPGEGAYLVQTFDSGLMWAGVPFADLAPARFGSGVQITGYALDGDTIWLRWALPAADDDQGHLRFFVHLLDADGSRLAQQDVDFWRGRYWCAGDTLVTGIALPQPAGTVTLRVGQYRLDEETGAITGIDVVDDAGQPLAPWVDVPLAG